MRRAFLGLAVPALAVLAFAGPAGAATGQVTHLKFSGQFADAQWGSSTATSQTQTVVEVVTQDPGSALVVDQFVTNVDASGSVTGYTDTSAEVRSGFSFTLSQPLHSASLSASGLPGQACTYDANFNLIGCSPASIDVTTAWTGQGPILRGVQNEHVKSGNASLTLHTNGTDRPGTATGTFNGSTLGTSQAADLGTAKEGSATICKGPGC